MATIDFDNSKGKGRIFAYNIFPGLAAITYDIRLYEDVKLIIGETPLNPVYFIFCLEGHLEHKFSTNQKIEKIHFQQNVNLSSSKSRQDHFIIPGNISLKISFIYLFREGIPEGPEIKANYLGSSLAAIFDEIEDDQPYNYFGRMLPRTAEYVRRLIGYEQTGIAGRLLTEASILNILASQLIEHEKEQSLPSLGTTLSREELERIANLSEYINENIADKLNIDLLKRKSRLSPKKLQEGFKHLFGQSVHGYLKNVRLEYAREQLELTDLTVSEIVYRIGISNSSNFSKNFRIRYGYLPTGYHKMLKAHIESL